MAEENEGSGGPDDDDEEVGARGVFLGEFFCNFGSEDADDGKERTEKPEEPIGNLNEAEVVGGEGGEVAGEGIGEHSAEDDHEGEGGGENPLAGSESGAEGFF